MLIYNALIALPFRRTLVVSACAGLALFAARRAEANPRSLPFTYPYATLSEGQAELEQAVDLTPLRYVAETGDVPWEPRYKLQTEFEYGISDRLELGLYLQFSQGPGSPLGFDGVKQRLRLRFAEAGDWPVDVAVYAELAELRGELELEQKLILEKTFGHLQITTNLWFEQEFEQYTGEIIPIANPTLGASYQITPTFRAGVEYWMRAVLKSGEPGEDNFNAEPHHFVGPALALVWGKLWWSAAAYARLDQMDRPVYPGDMFGHVWVRSVIGLSL